MQKYHSDKKNHEHTIEQLKLEIVHLKNPPQPTYPQNVFPMLPWPMFFNQVMPSQPFETAPAPQPKNK